MAGGVQLIDEAEESLARERVSDRRWLVVLGAFLVGGFTGAILFGSAVLPTAPSMTEATLPPPSASTLQDDAPGLGEVVEGFDDALVAVVGSTTGIDYLLWPIARGPTLRAIPTVQGEAATIDPTGVWIATLTPVPGSAGDLLSLGRSTSIRPVVTDVDSYVWHDTTPGLLAFLRFDERSWSIWEASAFPVPTKRVDLGPEYPGSLVAYGSWGWALQRAGEFEVVSAAQRGPDGSGVMTYPGTLLDTRDDVFLAYDSGRVQVIRNGLPLMHVERPVVSAGALSPDGSKAALIESGGVSVLEFASGEVVFFPLSPQSTQLAWADNRFVVVPSSPRGVRILDLERGEMTLQLTQYTVYWAGTIGNPGS
ncbi:MAG TPA: hypothetical protein VF246_10120 [Acidimicrobiia bacterium]